MFVGAYFSVESAVARGEWVVPVLMICHSFASKVDFDGNEFRV